MVAIEGAIDQGLVSYLPMSFLLFDRTDYKVSLNNSFSFQSQTFNSTTTHKE